MKIKLYHPKSRAVRELEEGDELRLRCLKRAGYRVGELPALPKAKQPVEAAPLPPTEGEELDASEAREPVMAEHAPVEILAEEKPAAKKKVAKKKAAKKAEAKEPEVFEIGDDGEPEEENEDE